MATTCRQYALTQLLIIAFHLDNESAEVVAFSNRGEVRNLESTLARDSNTGDVVTVVSRNVSVLELAGSTPVLFECGRRYERRPYAYGFDA
jgi:hypothetical protein